MLIRAYGSPSILDRAVRKIVDADEQASIDEPNVEYVQPTMVFIGKKLAVKPSTKLPYHVTVEVNDKVKVQVLYFRIEKFKYEMAIKAADVAPHPDLDMLMNLSNVIYKHENGTLTAHLGTSNQLLGIGVNVGAGRQSLLVTLFDWHEPFSQYRRVPVSSATFRASKILIEQVS